MQDRRMIDSNYFQMKKNRITRCVKDVLLEHQSGSRPPPNQISIQHPRTYFVQLHLIDAMIHSNVRVKINKFFRPAQINCFRLKIFRIKQVILHKIKK